MKAKKLLVTALAALTAASIACAFTACDSKNQTKENETKENETTIVYQLEGEYTDDTLKTYGYDYFYLLNLYSDNTLTYSGYNQMGMDTSAYASNSAFSEKWGRGKWEEGKDVEDQDCINITLIYDTDAGTSVGQSYTYSVYENSSGIISFTIDVPFQSGRQSAISGSKTIKYADYDKFIAAHEYAETLPENSAAVLEDDTNHYRVYCMDGGTASLYSGREDAGKGTYKYIFVKDGTWNYSAGALTFNFGSDVEAVIDGNAVTLNYSYGIYATYTADLTLTCADGSKLFVENGGSEVEQPLATFTNADNEKLSLKVYADGTAVFTGSYSSTEFTWTRSGNTITFTEKDGGTNEPKVVTSTVGDDNSCTFEYVNSYNYGGMEVDLGGTVTCADVSAIPERS